ncbi:MAG: PepSY domain-containing protein [Rhizobiales bacterium]|nr:PepSY domain-containing protein [Hyphomicrobiales bacterium]
MKYILSLLAAGLMVSAGGAAMASGDNDNSNHCPSYEASQWRSFDDVSAAAEALGYTVDSVEKDDGCYEIEGRDANGVEVEVYFDPVSLKIIKGSGEDDDGKDDS